MKVDPKVLRQIGVKEDETRHIELINIQTGEVDERYCISKEYAVFLTRDFVNNRAAVYVRFLPNKRYNSDKIETHIQESVRLDFDKLTIEEIAAIFTVVKQVKEEHAHDFDDFDIDNLYAQQTQRNKMREKVLKEEEKYTNKLLLEEVKRLAKENVDARRPPVTHVIPTKKKTKALT